MKDIIIRRPLGDNPPEARLIYGVTSRVGMQMLEKASVQAICTSPPYFNLRDYGADPEIWGGDPACGHSFESDSCSSCGAWRGGLGLEATPDLFVQHLVEVFREAKRVLRPDGVLWLNLGDSYAGSGKAGNNPEYQDKHTMFGQTVEGAARSKFGKPTGVPDGLKAKDLIGIPWRVAFALQADGWYLRSACPWIKANCMPESVRDRPTVGNEYIFLFAHPESQGRYFYDVDAVRAAPASYRVKGGSTPTSDGYSTHGVASRSLHQMAEGGRNRRTTDWWVESLDIAQGEIEQAKKTYGVVHDNDGVPIAFKVNPKPYTGAHFAVWPPKLVEPMVLASTSQHGCCETCQAPWSRMTGRDCESCGDFVASQAKSCSSCGSSTPGKHTPRHPGGFTNNTIQVGQPTGAAIGGDPSRNDGGVHVRQPKGSGGGNELARTREMGGWIPTCDCEGNEGTGKSVVLDPFSGSGTTGKVALKHGRNYIGIDLNEDYLDLAQARILGQPAPKEQEQELPVGILDLF